MALDATPVAPKRNRAWLTRSSVISAKIPCPKPVSPQPRRARRLGLERSEVIPRNRHFLILESHDNYLQFDSNFAANNDSIIQLL